MTALYIVLIILAVIMLILLIPADCVIDFSYNKEENRGSVIIKYLFLKFRIFPAKKKLEEEAEEAEETEEETKKENDIKSVIRLVKTVYSELKEDIFKLTNHFFTHTIRIKELNISAVFGTGNPMYTGIAAGAVNAVVYNAVSVIDRHMKLDKWNVSLDSDFDNLRISAGVYCKIRTNCIYVIKLGIMILILLLKIQKINRRIKKNG